MSKGSRSNRILRHTMFALYSAVMVVVILSVVEFAAMRIAARNGLDALPFLIDAKARSAKQRGILQVGGTQKMSYLDPHLGHAHEHAVDLRLSPDGALPGFVVLGDAESESGLRIVTLGGSTTDPLDKHNWTKVLHKRLETAGIEAVTFNGGVSGYSSNQELLKLLRDGLPLEPNLVISLNGINDLGFLHSLSDHPMVHPYQKRTLDHLLGSSRSLLLPNTQGLIRHFETESMPGQYRVKGANFGPVIRTTPWEQWARNIRLARAIATEMGVEYLTFLQPVLGVGDYRPTPEEDAMLEEADRKKHGKYVKKLRDFYQHARPRCAELPFCVDLCDLFADGSGLYRDARHPNQDGYRLTAIAIEDTLRERALLPDSAAIGARRR